MLGTSKCNIPSAPWPTLGRSSKERLWLTQIDLPIGLLRSVFILWLQRNTESKFLVSWQKGKDRRPRTNSINVDSKSSLLLLWTSPQCSQVTSGGIWHAQNLSSQTLQHIPRATAHKGSHSPPLFAGRRARGKWDYFRINFISLMSFTSMTNRHA